jgi:hypothetical protein
MKKIIHTYNDKGIGNQGSDRVQVRVTMLSKEPDLPEEQPSLQHSTNPGLYCRVARRKKLLSKKHDRPMEFAQRHLNTLRP